MLSNNLDVDTVIRSTGRVNQCQVRGKALYVSIPKQIQYGFLLDEKKKVWFGNTLGFPSQTTSAILLNDKQEVSFGNIQGYPSHLTLIQSPFVGD